MDKIEFLDQNILDRLYSRTSTGETFTFEDFLKIPVNDEYLKNKLKSNTNDIKATTTVTTTTTTTPIKDDK